MKRHVNPRVPSSVAVCYRGKLMPTRKGRPPSGSTERKVCHLFWSCAALLAWLQAREALPGMRGNCPTLSTNRQRTTSSQEPASFVLLHGLQRPVAVSYLMQICWLESNQFNDAVLRRQTSAQHNRTHVNPRQQPASCFARTARVGLYISRNMPSGSFAGCMYAYVNIWSKYMRPSKD